jgi:hypothetical protein
MRKMTVLEALALAKKCDRLFSRAANAWERGSNSGKTEIYKKCLKQSDNYRNKAEELLKPLGIEVDYPGLMPAFKVNGFHQYTTLNAISAALEGK